MVAATLASLQIWYSEPSQGTERPQLLSKLAILELCGWLEHWIDDLVLEVAQHCICTQDFVEKIIKNTNGFHYDMHIKGMLSKLIGEHQFMVGEYRMETTHPGELQNIKSMLGQLWKTRCSYAHSDLLHNVQAQATFDAPSWTITQHQALEQRLTKFKAIFVQLASEIPQA
ncbi:hypothetical protein R1521_04065 [Rhizobium brockwellii]|uniref:Apea-like HEPN domain-containing protein n=1 Tax=Rhizobium brockwellii TaxID=3019932 RepID=A0ABU3YFQ2_9HYPH|nr:hypothetical protein [Rhizobium brockwellii]MDV4177686.1 hypothetical protein [Rhizobium brockwellii]MDV4184685.1 hypothetical protein [Rhizobium brockwellii]